jgi:hypothetical protein
MKGLNGFWTAAVITALTLFTTIPQRAQTTGSAEIPVYAPASLVVKVQTSEETEGAPYTVRLSRPSEQAAVTFKGTVIFNNIEPGEYTVRVNGNKGQAAQRVTVKPGSSDIVTVPLAPFNLSGVQLTLNVREPITKEPAEGVVVRTQAGWETTTDAEGNATFFGHPAGLTLIWYSALGETDSTWLDLTAGSKKSDTVYVGLSGSMLAVNEPLAFYPLDGHVRDYGPKNAHGENVGGSRTTNYKGVNGAAMGFNGETYAEIPHAAWQKVHPMSISFRLKVDPDNPNTVFILGKYLHPTGEGWTIFLEHGLLCAGDFRDRFRHWSRVNTTTTIRDGKWHHVVLTIDGRQLTMYVDGARVPARPYTAPVEPSVTDEPIRLGKLRSTIWDPMPGLKGAIDDFALFDRALTEEEIRKLAE